MQHSRRGGGGGPNFVRKRPRDDFEGSPTSGNSHPPLSVRGDDSPRRGRWPQTHVRDGRAGRSDWSGSSGRRERPIGCGKVPRAVGGAAAEKSVVVILEKAGILLGRDGTVDAYDRAATTEIANSSLQDVRPDIVHQCLLALFDSELASQGRLRVYISLFDRSGKTIEVSPELRPPRTLARFKGLMAAVLRDGSITSSEGQTLMRILPGSIAPIVPYNAEVIGINNDLNAPVQSARSLAKEGVLSPVSNKLQGGVKDVYGFYCISCTDDCDISGVDYITKSVCLSEFPTSAHVACSRICEGYFHQLERMAMAPSAGTA